MMRSARATWSSKKIRAISSQILWLSTTRVNRPFSTTGAKRIGQSRSRCRRRGALALDRRDSLVAGRSAEPRG
jgi:hypothetical protein